jgi:hypothetical protein
MNALLFRTTVSTTLLLTATLVFADHNVRRELEDKAFAALSQAREIRIEIRDDFTGSRSFDQLMEEATQLYRTARSIEDALLRGESANVLCREIDQTTKALRCFSGILEASDFARVDVGHHRPTHGGNGYSFRASSRNPGLVHVVAVRQMVKELEITLTSLHDDLSLLSEVRPTPRAPFPAPSVSRPRSTFDLPVSLGNRGGFVLRIPMK